MARKGSPRNPTAQHAQAPAPAAQESSLTDIPVRKRTRARELALQALYQLDLRGEEVEIDQFLQDNDEEAAVREFALALVRGCWEHRDQLDEHIRSVALNWHLSRMATIDRNILRLATYELLHRPDIPAKVSINEAIDLAKKFSTAESGAFVNGILDKIRAGHAAAK